MRYCSTDEVAERTGATFRQLDYWVRRGYVTPSTVASIGARAAKPNARRWSPTDIAAAGAVVGIISQDSDGAVTELAKLAARAVYRWHLRAGWVVVALPDTVEPCWSAEEVAAVAAGHTVCTVVPLEVPS